jgi:hypothetical protein
MPPSRRQDYLDHILAKENAVMEYDRITGGLRAWPW